MTSSYINEPATKGKILLKTTHGDIDIELWSRETPLACKNFVQHCFNGYFDNTIFHRVLPDKLIQGGDPTGSGLGGDSVNGGYFKDEFHSRIKFSRRGMVAMANEGKRNTNKSQFFITLSDCPWLNRKHTIFGKVTGDTIFNVIEMAKGEIGENDRPLHPAKILNTEILLNPFPKIKPPKNLKNNKNLTKNNKNSQNDKNGEKIVENNVKNKLKFSQNKSLLSFDVDDDFDNDGEIEFIAVKKFKSAHDLAIAESSQNLDKNLNNNKAKNLDKKLDNNFIKNEKNDKNDKNDVKIDKNVVKFVKKSKNFNKIDKNDTKIAKNEKNEKKVPKSEIEIAREEYLRVKKEFLKSNAKREKKRLESIKGGSIISKKKQPKTLLEKRIEKYHRRGYVNKEKHSAETLKKVKQFNKFLSRRIKSFERSDTKIEVDSENEEWIGDGKLKFVRPESRLNDFKLDDYVVKDYKKNEK